MDVVTATGVVTANGGVVFNEGSADVDFRVESNGSTHMLFVDGGNNTVGIGTSSPTALMHINGGSTAADGIHYIANNTSSGPAGIVMNSGHGNWKIMNSQTVANALEFIDGGSPDVTKMMIHSNGNVGIGVTAPTAPLTVKANADARSIRVVGRSDDISEIDFMEADDSTLISRFQARATFFAVGTIANVPLVLRSNNTDRVTIAANGDMFVVNDVYVGGTNGNPVGNHVSQALISGADGTGIHRDGGTPFKIGTDGDRAIQIMHINGADVGSIDVSGSSTSYTTSSDYRLKTDVQPMTGASARVLALKPVNFQWISDGSRTDGFLAHEAQAVVPEAVTGTKDAMQDEEYEVTPAALDDDGNETKSAVMGTRSVPEMQGIDQSKIVPLLVAALQEALARITVLEG